MTITIYDNNTGNVLACFDPSGEREGFFRDDIGIFIQGDADPVLIERDGELKLHPNAFMIKL